MSEFGQNTLKHLFTALCILTMTWALSACGTARVHAPDYTFSPDDARQIDDDSIARAFEAKPQLPAKFNVAYFAFEDSKSAEYESWLKQIEGVEGVYHIPSVWAGGQRRFQNARHTWPPQQPKVPSIKELRLLAARAHCDVLVVFDYGYHVKGDVNGWAALNILLVTPLFTPFLDQAESSYLDVYLVDVRNGYLYGSVATEESSMTESLTIWETDDAEQEALAASWSKLAKTSHDKVHALVEKNKAVSAALRARPPETTRPAGEPVGPAAKQDDTP